MRIRSRVLAHMACSGKGTVRNDHLRRWPTSCGLVAGGMRTVAREEWRRDTPVVQAAHFSGEEPLSRRNHASRASKSIQEQVQEKLVHCCEDRPDVHFALHGDQENDDTTNLQCIRNFVGTCEVIVDSPDLVKVMPASTDALHFVGLNDATWAVCSVSRRSTCCTNPMLG